MARSSPRAWIVVAGMFAASHLLAADVAEPTTGRPAANAPATATSRSRAVSPGIAELLRAATPNYAPPVASTAETLPPETGLPKADGPRNTIIRLPTYVVREDRPPAFKDRDLLTAQGRLDLGYQRRPGLRAGSLGPLRNDVWAKVMLEEDFALERRKEMQDLLGLLPAGSRPPPLLSAGAPFELPRSYSGPTAGLVVPWERR